MTGPKLINGILKGTEVLKCLAEGTDRLKEVSDRLHLNKSTAHRLLKTLEEAGLVMQDPLTRRYYLGPLIIKLAGSPSIAHQNLIICSRGEMERLRDITGETVVLHVRTGLQRICLNEIISLHPIKYTSGQGYTAPVHIGSAGKVLLAELPDDEIEVLLSNINLEQVGPNTITDKQALLDELEKVRQSGYATSFGERIAGSASISVPIKNYICPVALSVLGLEVRFRDQMMNALEEMKISSQNISAKIAGFEGTPR